MKVKNKGGKILELKKSQTKLIRAGILLQLEISAFYAWIDAKTGLRVSETHSLRKFGVKTGAFSLLFSLVPACFILFH